jgi:hypothetical protein
MGRELRGKVKKRLRDDEAGRSTRAFGASKAVMPLYEHYLS